MFPSNDDDDEDPISVKKLIKLDGQWDIEKELVECTFEGIKNSMVLEEKKMITIIVVLKEWLRSRRGVPFSELHKAVAKVMNAANRVPAARALFSDSNRLIWSPAKKVAGSIKASLTYKYYKNKLTSGQQGANNLFHETRILSASWTRQRMAREASW